MRRGRGWVPPRYERYWFDYVAKRWKEHGLDRAAAAGRAVATLDCHARIPEKAAQLEAIIRGGV